MSAFKNKPAPSALSLFSLFLTFLTLSSCFRDKYPNPKAPKDVGFVVSISVPNDPATRAIPRTGFYDNLVQDITILLFDPSSGAWAGYAQATEINTIPGKENLKRFKVLINPDTYKALFIANAYDLINQHCDLEDGSYRLGGEISLADIETELLTLIHAGDKYNAEPGSSGYRPFYMCSAFEQLTVPIPADKDYEETPIKLSRDVAKIDLQVDPSVSAKISLQEILLCNYNCNDYVVPAPGWWLAAPDPLFAAGPSVTRPIHLAPALADAISYSGSDFDASGSCIDEVFTYESPAGNLFLLVRANVMLNGSNQADRWYKLDFRKEDPLTHTVKPVNILRNWSYSLVITEVSHAGYDTAKEAFDNEPQGLTVTLEAVDEPGINDFVYGEHYYIGVDQSELYYYHNSDPQILRIFTDYMGGWKIGNITYDAGGQNWLSFDPNPPQTATANTVVSTPVAISAAAHTGSMPRVATFDITAGILTKTITIIQFPPVNKVSDNLGSDVTPFVGAFWKANQWGERLIRTSRPASGVMDGAWMAVVLEGRDWIVLDTLMTSDPNVGWRGGANESAVHNGNDAGFDLNHGVFGTSTEIKGTLTPLHDLYFRIGLKTAYSPTPAAPVRYGVVLLWCKDKGKTHRIWIRQGEGVDFIPGRTSGLRWSPYNLGNYNDPVYHPQRFVHYPSQGGYYYQWGYSANIDTPSPYHPINPPNASPGWTSVGSGALYTLDNACPDGFETPVADEFADFVTAGFGGSGYTTPVAGFYADGFFDRRALVTPPGNLPRENGAVSYYSTLSDPRNQDVAYMGLLLFHTANNGSIFFPFTGNRSQSIGLSFLGEYADYWTGWRGPYGPGAWGEVTFQPLFSGGSYGASSFEFGHTVRCVETVLSVVPSSLWLSPSTGNTSKTITITSSGPWVASNLPANASLSSTTGTPGITTITLTRSNANFGADTFVVTNTQTGKSVTVNVDNYFIDDDEEFLISNSASVGNTGTYQLFVYGGSETFTIVDYSSWITSATILPSGELQLMANQSPDGEPRTGYITLAHANDPTYQVTIPVIQDYNIIPPFKYFVMKFTWVNQGSTSCDVDIAVEFAGNGLPVTGGGVTYNFDTQNYVAGGMGTGADSRAVGWGLKSLVGVGGNTVNYSQNPSFTPAQLADNLMFWGGDARSGEGETVFFNAPKITPADPRNDNSGLNRYIYIEVYNTIYSGTAGNPVRMTLSTYNDRYLWENPVSHVIDSVNSIMMKPSGVGVTGSGINALNFYCVPEGTSDAQLRGANGTGYLLPPLWTTNRVNQVSSSTQFNDYRNRFTHICTITYDRYKRSATVNWLAGEYTGSIVPPY